MLGQGHGKQLKGQGGKWERRASGKAGPEEPSSRGLGLDKHQFELLAEMEASQVTTSSWSGQEGQRYLVVKGILLMQVLCAGL